MTNWSEWPVTAWAAVVCGGVFVILVIWMLVASIKRRSGAGTEPWLLRAPLLRACARGRFWPDRAILLAAAPRVRS